MLQNNFEKLYTLNILGRNAKFVICLSNYKFYISEIHRYELTPQMCLVGRGKNAISK